MVDGDEGFGGARKFRSDAETSGGDEVPGNGEVVDGGEMVDDGEQLGRGKVLDGDKICGRRQSFRATTGTAVGGGALGRR